MFGESLVVIDEERNVFVDSWLRNPASIGRRLLEEDDGTDTDTHAEQQRQ